MRVGEGVGERDPGDRMGAVIPCVEEEYAAFFTWPARRRDGWRWVPFYLRGPALPGPVANLLTPLGVWRFARSPRRLIDLPEEEWRGARVVDSCPGLGSYGMGGPGFLGLKCDLNRRAFWIVFTLWAATGWLNLGGRLLEEGLSQEERKAYSKRGISSIEVIHGSVIESISFTPDLARFRFTKGGEGQAIELRRDGTRVPPWRGGGGRKVFLDEESLEDAVVVTRRGRLWSGSDTESPD